MAKSQANCLKPQISVCTLPLSESSTATVVIRQNAETTVFNSQLTFLRFYSLIFDIRLLLKNRTLHCLKMSGFDGILSSGTVLILVKKLGKKI